MSHPACTAGGEAEPVFVPQDLRPEGVGPSFDVIPEAIRPHVLRCSTAASLADLAPDYVFLSHAALFCYGRWNESMDPIVQHIIETNGVCTPFHLQLPSPVFKFLDKKDADGNVVDEVWNSRLVVAPRDQWPGLCGFLASVAGKDAATGYFVTTLLQKVPIVDVLWLDKQTVLPDRPQYVDCYVLAVSSNKQFVRFAPEYRQNPFAPIPLVQSSPQAQVIKLARAIFADARNPLAGVTEPTAAEALDAVKKS